eukprot:6204297-Pleurochrysis_carterae.AAC.8
MSVRLHTLAPWVAPEVSAAGSAAGTSTTGAGAGAGAERHKVEKEAVASALDGANGLVLPAARSKAPLRPAKGAPFTSAPNFLFTNVTGTNEWTATPRSQAKPAARACRSHPSIRQITDVCRHLRRS